MIAVPNLGPYANPPRSSGGAVANGKKPTEPGWPIMDPAALYGLPGDIVRKIELHTEADPCALLITFLAAFGNAVGAKPHAMADGAAHPGRIFPVIVGRTSKSRKGTSWRHIYNIFSRADLQWTEDRVKSGLSSGEGLIGAVSDGVIDKDGNTVGAVADKRLFMVEEEFSRTLIVKGRKDNTLSAIVRQAWDVGNLHSLTRTQQAATGSHISILGHITVEELRRSLNDGDVANGFANRFLYVCARRSQLLPHGGHLSDTELLQLGGRVAVALERARKLGRITRTSAAAARWEQLYQEMADDDAGGLVGMLTDRGEAQLLRLSVIYALADGSHVVDLQHLEAAKAVWSYCAESVRYIFGERSGDPDADKLLAAIRAAGPAGLDGTSQRDALGHHVDASQVRLRLEDRGLIVTERVVTPGRSAIVSKAVQ